MNELMLFNLSFKGFYIQWLHLLHLSLTHMHTHTLYLSFPLTRLSIESVQSTSTITTSMLSSSTSIKRIFRHQNKAERPNQHEMKTFSSPSSKAAAVVVVVVVIVVTFDYYFRLKSLQIIICYDCCSSLWKHKTRNKKKFGGTKRNKTKVLKSIWMFKKCGLLCWFIISCAFLILLLEQM